MTALGVQLAFSLIRRVHDCIRDRDRDRDRDRVLGHGLSPTLRPRECAHTNKTARLASFGEKNEPDHCCAIHSGGGVHEVQRRKSPCWTCAGSYIIHSYCTIAIACATAYRPSYLRVSHHCRFRQRKYHADCIIFSLLFVIIQYLCAQIP
jgi:hypothetical protein